MNKPILHISTPFKLRTLRGTFKYFEVDDPVRLLTITCEQKLLVQPLNAQLKPSTRFPYIITRDQVNEKVDYWFEVIDGTGTIVDKSIARTQ